MKKVFAVLFALILLSSCASENTVKSDFTDNGAVISWKGMPFYSTGNLYYESITYKDGGFYWRLENGFEKLSDIGGNRLWSYNGVAYFSTNPWIDEKEVIYQSGISVYDAPKKLMDGRLNFVSNSGHICLTDNRDIYTSDIYGNNKKLIATGGNYINFHNNIIYYSTNEKDISPSSVSLFSYDIATEKTEQLATHGPELLARLQISQLEVVGDRIVYSVGVYMGSGNYFTGNIFSANLNGGSNKKIHSIEHTNFDSFHKLKGNIIYQENVGEVKLIPSKGGKVKPLSEDIHRVAKTDGNYVYYQTENGDLYRSNADFKDNKLMVKASDLPNVLHEEHDFLRFRSIDVIDNTLYFTAEAWGYRTHYGWRDQFLNRTFGQIELDGSNLMIHQHVISDAQYQIPFEG
jgi:hypothetical protein